MIERILQENETFLSEIAELRRLSPYYPAVKCKNRLGGTVYLSTLVRIQRNGVWWEVHLVKSAYEVPLGGNIEWLYEQLMFQAHLIQYFHMPIEGLDERCKSQISEKQRLKEENPQLFPKKEEKS